MTEKEWVQGCDPTVLLIHLHRAASSRKLRLMACECARRNQHFNALPGSRDVLATTEAWADSNATGIETTAAFERLDWWSCSSHLQNELGAMALGFCSEDAYAAVIYTIAWATADDDPVGDAQLAMRLRDIFGNPFRPVVADPAWLTPTVRSLASAIYADRAFERLPILADALEVAGCTDADLLLHCRTPGEHVRGCWVVDLVLGKA